jgi:hypothetical protein
MPMVKFGPANISNNAPCLELHIALKMRACTGFGVWGSKDACCAPGGAFDEGCEKVGRM